MADQAALISAEIRDFIRVGRNFAALTTMGSDAHPSTHVMWVDCDDQHVLINTERHRRKFVNVTRDPRVTVMVWDAESPYRFVEVRGVVESTRGGKEAREHIDALSQKYHGCPYQPAIVSARVVLEIRPFKIVTKW